MNNKWLNGAVIVGVATSIGAGLSYILSPDQVSQVGGWGDTAASAVAIVGTALSAFLLALRKRS